MKLLAPRGAAARFKAARQPGPDTPWRQAGWCAVDLELTGGGGKPTTGPRKGS